MIEKKFRSNKVVLQVLFQQAAPFLAGRAQQNA